jgi:hypothetical protein
MEEKKDIIRSETKIGEGIYSLNVDRDRASKLEGNDNAERLNNAIRDFLSEGRIEGPRENANNRTNEVRR